MSIDLSQLSNLQNTAIGLSNLILVNPQNDQGVTAQIPNPDKFLFNYEGEQSVELANEITDHYVEDNTAIQDQIALKPVIIKTQGYVGELNDIAPPLLAPAKIVRDKLTTVGAYLPSISVTAQLVYNQAFQAYQVAQLAIGSAVSAWNTVAGSGAPIQNKQQMAFQKFAGYRDKRVLFTVQTPWAVYQNMAILTLIAHQDADTRVITDFQITFKKVNFVTSNTAAAQNGDTRYFSQSDGTVTIGANKPNPSIESQDAVTSVYGQ